MARGGGGAEPRAATIPGKRVERKLARARFLGERDRFAERARSSRVTGEGGGAMDVLYRTGNVTARRFSFYWPPEVLQPKQSHGPT